MQALPRHLNRQFTLARRTTRAAGAAAGRSTGPRGAWAQCAQVRRRRTATLQERQDRPLRPLPVQARRGASPAHTSSYSVLDDQSLMGNWMNSLYCFTRLPSLPASASSAASSFRCSVMRVPRGRSAASSSRTCATAHRVTPPLTPAPDLAPQDTGAVLAPCNITTTADCTVLNSLPMLDTGAVAASTVSREPSDAGSRALGPAHTTQVHARLAV